MSKKIKTFDDKINLPRSFSRIKIEKGNSSDWTDGEVVTPDGIVTVYAQGDNDSFYCSRLDFSHKGRLYIRHFNNIRYSPQFLVTAANRFAKEIVKNNK